MRDVTERKKSEEQLLAALREKEVLIKEIHHRVKNNLQVITSLLNLQAGHIEDKSLKDSLEQTRNRVRAIATIHDLLYKSGSLARVDMASHIQTLSEDLYSLYGVSPGKVRVDVQVHNVQLQIEQAIPCSLIVNELLSNAFKYAFPNDKEGQVSIAFERVDAASYRLAIHDNGIGLPQGLNFRDTQSLGLQLINIFVEQLQGSVELIAAQGTHLEIVFPAETGSNSEAG
jgi:two-component sensor histidine kinase